MIKLIHKIKWFLFKDKYISEWRHKNYELGVQLGYPECCIEEFCNNPPEYLVSHEPSRDDYIRFQSSKLNGEYTGFIPCKKHAYEINHGEISLNSLINNRNRTFKKFPLE